jgi:hypothetical protein
MRQVVALVVCLSLFLQGCTAMQAVPAPQDGPGTAAVEGSDTVQPTTDDEKRQDERKKRTVWWILGGAALVALIAGGGGGGGSSY